MAHDPTHPQVLGRYRLLHPLGRGAHGTVYKAVQSGPGDLQRTVALKVLHAGAAGLWHEARLGGLLRHPHLVDVYEVGEVDGQVFCAMEWCEGGALTGWAPLPPRAVVDAGIQVCAALAYAYEQLGIVHLDLKPANLFLDRHGVKVGDWGIAREQGIVPAWGTAGFMPPEQRRGEAVDARADVYALGVTLARLALGDAAVAALTYVPQTGALPTLDLSGDAVTTESGDELSVPDWLRDVVMRCIQPDPADRWPSMAALADALGGLEVEGVGLRELLQQGAPVAPATAEREVRLFGRDTVVQRIEALLSAERALVTLKGAPGVGKSQVARAIAARWRGRGARVIWCDLEGVDHLDAALRRLAQELGTPLTSEDRGEVLSRLARVLEALGDTLVVFDNAGRALEDPRALHAWDAGPRVRWVLTSRQPLHLPAEVVVDLPPLALDACHDVFWAAARRRGVPRSSHEALDALFERLDRLPLAIELVAGRLGVLTVDDIVANTELGFLRSGQTGRHATLHTTLAFSWGPLSAIERRALQALAAFHGRIPVAAIEQVLAPLGDPLDLLAALSDRSLLVSDGTHPSVLAIVRDYVRDVGPDPHGAELSHGAWVASLGDAEGRGALYGHGGQQRWELIADSIDDVELACERAVDRGDGAMATACLLAWWAVGALRGPFPRGTELARRVLALPGLSAADEAAATMVHGHAQRLAGELQAAESSLLRALAIADREHLEEVGLQAAVALAGVYASLSRVAEAHATLEHWVTRADGAVPPGLLAVGLAQWGALPGHPDGARAERLGRAASLARASGYRRAEGMAVQVLAALDHMGNRRSRAKRRYRAALQVFDEIGDRRFTAILGSNLAMLLVVEGHHAQALEALDEALRACLEMGDRRQEIVVRIAFGDAHLYRGDGAAAVPPLQAARAQAQATGVAQRASVASLGLARAWALVGDAQRAQAALDEALRLHAVDEAELLTVRGHMALSFGDRATAEALLAQARAVATALHAQPIAELQERLVSPSAPP